MNTSDKNPRLLYTGTENYDHVDLDAGATFFAKALGRMGCPCCQTGLNLFTHDLSPTTDDPDISEVRWLKLKICPACRWWHFSREINTGRNLGEHDRATWWELTHALLTEIDLTAPTLSLANLSQHLMRHWEDRKLISAQQAEDLVASILKEHYGGEVVRLGANANTADGGIDLYISSRDGVIQRAIQVKRRITTEVESVKEVRNFVGAMVLAGAAEGLFVTTASRFSQPALQTKTRARASKHQLELELVDGEQLLEMLEVTNTGKAPELPPLARLDQEWRDEKCRPVLAKQLFMGDYIRLRN